MSQGAFPTTRWRSPHRATLFASWLLVVLVAQTAAAQETSQSFDQLRVLVKPGDTISVLTPAGTLTQGRIATLSGSTLSLDVKGVTRDFSEADVSRILQRRRDPLGNGANWGLAIGAAIGAVPILVSSGSGATGYAIMGAAILGGIGAGIGAAADAAHTTTHVIYTRPVGTTTSVRLAPMVSARRAGAVVTIGF